MAEAGRRARNEALDCRVYAYAALHALYASGLKLTVHCDRFAQMGRSRRKEMQSVPPAVVVAQASNPNGLSRYELLIAAERMDTTA